MRVNVAVIGLGKLGSPLAACFASRGHQVRGADLNQRVVQLLNQGQAPIFEPGLANLLEECGDRLSAGTDIGWAVCESDATFIIVPTPSDRDGAFTPRHVLAAARAVGQALRQKDGYHLVVVTSTVMP